MFSSTKLIVLFFPCLLQVTQVRLTKKQQAVLERKEQVSRYFITIKFKKVQMEKAVPPKLPLVRKQLL